MIIILDKSEVKKFVKMKKAGKGDQAIMAHILATAKFDMRVPANFNDENYPVLDMKAVVAEALSEAEAEK